MKLLTKAIVQQLRKNGEVRKDAPPVVKFFTPDAGATWLISEMDPDEPDLLFGLCDLGMGFPELGNVSLTELASIRGPFGLRVERDLYTTLPDFPLSVYAEAASAAGRITTKREDLEAAAARIQARKAAA